MLVKRCGLILVICLLFASSRLHAQHGLGVTLKYSTAGRPLAEVLQQLEKDEDVRLFFLPEWFVGYVVERDFQRQTLDQMLTHVLQGSDISFVAMYPQVIVFFKDPEAARVRKEALVQASEKGQKVNRRQIGDPASGNRDRVSLFGKVLDQKSSEALPGTNVVVVGGEGTTTRVDGSYELMLQPGQYVVSFSHLDFETQLIDIAIYDSGELTVELGKQSILLDEVVVQEQAIPMGLNSRFGEIQLVARSIKRAPALMGEPDLIKQLQTLPGVTTAGEAAAGYNVRGGTVDQNLILYDGVPIYNSSHALGFLSAFNTEGIRDMTFYRSGIPAEFGGRVSSVLDIRSRDGGLEKWSGNVGVGLVTSNVSINGPLVKDKTGISASWRTTYSDWLVNSIRTDYVDLRESSVRFYDGALKLNHVFSPRTRFSLTTYLSQDAFRLTGDTTYRWGNRLISARLNHQFEGGWNGDFVLGQSYYGYEVDNTKPVTAARLSFRIATTSASAHFTRERQHHKLATGWQLQYHRINPGSLIPASPQSNAATIDSDDQHALESALYFSDAWQIHSRLTLEAGLRVPVFIAMGPATVYTYGNGAREPSTRTDTLTYRAAEPIKAYLGWEPRFSALYKLDQRSSLKLAFNRIYQFLHLISNTTAVTPVDIWQPSGYFLRPQIGNQISVGIDRQLKDRQYFLGIEGYYKHVENLVDFKDGAQLVLNPSLETDLLQGYGYAYGLEFYATRNTGVLTGTASYTYSRSWRVVSGPSAAESINRGAPYPSNFDQPHILNIGWKLNFSRRYFLTGNFTYHTGRPVTIPVSLISFENTTVAYFSARNQYRIPDYHRLDIALVIEGTNKKKKSMQGMWVFSVYNVYGRQNPYTVFFKSDANGVPKPYQLSVIGTVFPSVSYNVKF